MSFCETVYFLFGLGNYPHNELLRFDRRHRFRGLLPKDNWSYAFLMHLERAIRGSLAARPPSRDGP
jgi:hypothetical protein